MPIAEAAAHLDMREATIINMITARSLAGYVDWGEVEAKLAPVESRGGPTRSGNCKIANATRDLIPRR